MPSLRARRVTLHATTHVPLMWMVLLFWCCSVQQANDEGEHA
jgi:hypothetical protein